MTILIQLKQYEEVKSTIEAVLEENQLPAESAEQFYRLLEFSRKMTDPDQQDEAWEEEYEDILDAEKVLNSPAEQMNLIHSLKDRNIAKYTGLLKTILQVRGCQTRTSYEVPPAQCQYRASRNRPYEAPPPINLRSKTSA